jgi:tRNA (cmo5U34)-methyltransferase
MVGVIYAFLDTYTLLKEVAELCDYALILDSVYPINMTHPESSIIGVVRHQHINSAQPGVAYTGAGARPSPMALRVLMSTLGWHTPEGLLYPAPMQDPHTHDSYRTPVERVGRSGIDLPGRYLMRFFHTDANPLATVSDRVQQQDPGNQAAMLPNISVGTNAASWSFDPEVAKRFQREAETHIPDYERVLRLSLDLADLCLDGRDYPLIDVGSALGHTMDLFRDRGYTNVWGVDNSESMRAQSSQQERVYLSDKFPKNKDWHLVLANWTLHFMPNREQYLQDIFDTMVSGGILILSDKMSHTSIEEQLYHQFKRDNGVSQEEIDLKKQRLVGVLTTRPLEWYLQTLQAIGFEDPQVVNSRYMFHTIYARRP